MTLAELSRLLSTGGVPDPDTDARLLISHLFGVSPAALYADRERSYESDALRLAVKRRLAREPLQYILGEAAFFEELYEVSPDCLIPRADTELLVEKAIALLPSGAHFADLGTGSGCVAISVLAHRGDLSAAALDVSESALALATRNAEKNGVSDRFTPILSDMRAPLPASAGNVTAILSNPPYIAAAVVDTLERELFFEPRLALDGGDDGLDFYRAILDTHKVSLYLFEIGFDQGAALTALAQERGLFCEIFKDLGGRDRVAVIKS